MSNNKIIKRIKEAVYVKEELQEFKINIFKEIIEKYNFETVKNKEFYLI